MPPNPSDTFPSGWALGTALALLIAGLGWLPVTDLWRPTYAVGCLAGIFMALAGLCYEWRRAHVVVSIPTNRFCQLLKHLAIAFTLTFSVSAIATIWLAIAAATIHPLQLIPHHPWDVEYGDPTATGQNRIYVIARADNTTRDTITFQQYSKAALEPNPTSVAFIQNPAIIESLRDEVRRLASGGGSPTITSYPVDSGPAHPYSLGPATFNILGPAISRLVYNNFRAGNEILYYDALVYVKVLPSGLRFAFEDCEIDRMIPGWMLIPGTGSTVELPRQLSEMRCDLSGT